MNWRVFEIGIMSDCKGSTEFKIEFYKYDKVFRKPLIELFGSFEFSKRGFYTMKYPILAVEM